LRGPLAVAVAFAGGVFVSTFARAQTTYVPTFGSSAPSAKAAPPPRPVEQTDHDDVRLRPGIGYLGRIDAPLGESAESTAHVHLLGVRFWFRRRIGIDVAAGFDTDLGSSDTSRRAFGARAALPIALFISDRLTLYVAPTVAYAQGAEHIEGKPGISPITGLARTPPTTKYGGLRASVGGRIGAELQFGFIGATRLAFSASVGLDVDFVRGWTSAAPQPTSRDPEPAVRESSANRFSVRTVPGSDPLASILGNIAVVCYF
jgi:hypothetical protein